MKDVLSYLTLGTRGVLVSKSVAGADTSRFTGLGADVGIIAGIKLNRSARLDSFTIVLMKGLCLEGKSPKLPLNLCMRVS